MKINIQITTGDDAPVATASELRAQKIAGIIATMVPGLMEWFERWNHGKSWRPPQAPPGSGAAGTTPPA